MRPLPCLAPLVLLVAACAAPPRGPAPPAPPPQAAAPAELPPAGARTWTVVASRLAVRVYRDGPMQRLGHDHLVTSAALAGRIELGAPLAATRFELSLPLDSLVVDDEAERAAAGGLFVAEVPPQDRAATRRNMLGEKLLDAGSQDTMRLRSESVTGGPDWFEARVRVSLAGRESLVAAPFYVTVAGDRLEARAGFSLTHAELGLEPFTVALGALRVREDFDVELTLEARRGS